MTFKEITEKLESVIGEQRKFELLESNYPAYAFGSGIVAYKVNGMVLKLIFDGRDGEITLLISPKHARYPRTEFKTIFTGNQQMLFSDSSFLEKAING
jgi:hypothetical protein